MKSHTKLLVSLLTIAIVANAMACSTKRNLQRENNVVMIFEVPNETFTKSIDEILEEMKQTTIKTEDIVDKNGSIKNIENDLKSSLYDENIDYEFVIKTYLELDYDKREELKNDYLRAIYMKMYNSSVSMNIYLEELHTLMLMQQIPMCVPEDIWYNSFNHLLELVPNCISLYDVYFDIAKFVHEMSCDKEHLINEYFGYSCDELEKEYTRTLTIPMI